ncbi:MAG: hypothetical protein ACK58L_05795 [Planctomycetota bacterium]
MNPALAQDRTALRVNLTVPTTAVRLGPFAFDGLKALIGMDLADVLASLMIGPRTQRPVLGGVVDVYPLAIPDGEGLSVPIKLLGEIGFYNLCFAKHKLYYAEPALMRSHDSPITTPTRISTSRTPHNVSAAGAAPSACRTG